MNLKDLCRLVLTTSLSNRQIGHIVDVSHNTAGRYRDRLLEDQLSWIEISMLSDAELEKRLNQGRAQAKQRFVEPDFTYVYNELRKPGVTKALLYEEYAAAVKEGVMSETEFRRRYKAFRKTMSVVMRQPRMPGYQLFLDYSGFRPRVTDPKTGETRQVEVFVAVLGASRKTFAFASETQNLRDWCEANVRALEFFQGVPTLLVPDNLKAAVDRITKNKVQIINHTYSTLATHYDSFVLPARVREPTDKAPVEIGVKLVKSFIFARLRNRTFFSIDELNQEIEYMLRMLNDRPMRGHQGKSRNQLFEELDRPALKPMPVERFEFSDWKLGITVAQDYHVVWEDHYYSVPYRYVGARVNLRASAKLIEVFHKNDNFPIATHLRSNVIGGTTTNPEHQPPAHRAFAQDDSAELIIWAERSGASISGFMKAHIAKHRKPQLSLQASRGLKNLARQHGVERLDAACNRALRLQATSVSSVRSMLQRGMESAPLRGEAANDPLPAHENVRGAIYG